MNQEQIQAKIDTLQGRYDRNYSFAVNNSWLSIGYLTRMGKRQDELYLQIVDLQEQLYINSIMEAGE